MTTNVLVRGHGIDADLIRKLHPLIRQATPVTEQDPLLQSWTIELSRSDDIPILVDRLLESGIRLYELTPKHPSLEEVFLYWVQRKEQEQRHVYDREVNL
jgi:ABC-2 type transport system ATP-binding protein